MSGRRRISPRRRKLRTQRRRVYRRILTFVDRAAAAAVFHALSLNPVRQPDELPPINWDHDGPCTPDGRGYCARCHRVIEED